MKYFVESAQAVETRCQRYFSHGHASFMDQMLGEKHTPRLCHGDGLGPEVLKKESPQLTFANAKTFRKRIDALSFAIKGTIGDQRQRP